MLSGEDNPVDADGIGFQLFPSRPIAISLTAFLATFTRFPFSYLLCIRCTPLVRAGQKKKNSICIFGVIIFVIFSPRH